MHSGVVQRLFEHNFQNLFESFGVGRVEEVSDATQALLHEVIHSHADDKRLDDDALFLECPAYSTRIFIAGFDAIRDQHNDVPSRFVREVLSSEFQ